MKKIILILELQNEKNISLSEIEMDIKTELGCAIYDYEVKSIEEQTTAQSEAIVK